MSHFPGRLLAGTLLRRYKRFLADVRFEDGKTRTVHCPNPGAMTGCMTPGSAVRISYRPGMGRKFPHTWELVRSGRSWVCVNTAMANRVVRRWIEEGRIFPGEGPLRAEVPVGKSRFDFALGDHTLIEVKSVTLKLGGAGAFPDAVTERGRRHLEELARLRGMRRVLLYFVARGDLSSVRAAEEIDPGYAAALREAIGSGVEVMAIGARFTPKGAVHCRGWLEIK